MQHWDSQHTKSWASSAVTPKKYRLRNQTQLGKKNLKHEDDSIIRSRIYHPKAPPQHAGWLGISSLANLIIPKSLVVHPLYNNISLYTPCIYNIYIYMIRLKFTYLHFAWCFHGFHVGIYIYIWIYLQIVPLGSYGWPWWPWMDWDRGMVGKIHNPDLRSSWVEG